MKRTKTIESIHRRIPYACCYETEGMIRVGEDRYSVMYRMDPVDPKGLMDYKAKVMESRMEDLLSSFPEDLSMQFLVHNQIADEDGQLARLLYDPEKKAPELKGAAKAYDEVLLDHAKVGHNNMRKHIYVVFAFQADCPEDAAKRFQELEEQIRESFRTVYGLSLTWCALPERLRVLHRIFHPFGTDTFGREIDPEGHGMISLKKLKEAGLTTKDLIAPESWNTSGKHLDFSVLNEKTDGRCYARAFFLNLIPKNLSPSMISDLTGVSSSMLFSLIYEPVDESLGFQEAALHVKRNTVIRNKPKRDTFLDRKNRTMERIEEMKESSERAYYEKMALRTLKEAKDRGQRAFLATVTVVLFAEDLEALEKDTELLRLSAVKFSASFSTLDLQQCEGFQTCLPLCRSRIHAERFLSARRLAAMTPTGIPDAIRQDGQYLGLNAVNDALILLNRKNNTNLNGLISGTRDSGKTYQCRREILNALLGSEDHVTVVTMGDDYDAFAGSLGGRIYDFPGNSLFDMEEGYGLTEGDLEYKALFLSAAVSRLMEPKGFLSAEDKERIESMVTEELRRFLMVARIEELRGEALEEYVLQMKEDYPCLVKAVQLINKRYPKKAEPLEGRFTVLRIREDTELLLSLDLLWNKAVREKKKNCSNWIFVDPADSLFLRSASAAYLKRYQEMASLFQTVVTLVIDHSAALFSEPKSSIALENALLQSGYIKLLNQGPQERRKLTGLLSIPQALIPYISNTEPGKGLILTPSSDIPFNDNYLELYPDLSMQRLLSA